MRFNGKVDGMCRPETLGGHMKRSISVAKSAAMIMLVTLGSKMLGFLREAVIAANYGTGIESDAYFIAQTIHYTLFYSVFASVSTVFIPIYTEKLLTEGEHSANRFANNVIHTLLLFSILICGLVTLLAKEIVLIFAPGFQTDSLNLTVKIIKTMFPMLVVTCLFNLFKGILQSRQSFLVPASTGYPFSIIIILGCIFFSPQYGIYALVVATVLGEISQLLIQLPALKGKYKYYFRFDIRDKELHRLGVVVLPVLIGTAVRQLNTLIDRALASNLGMGNISAINYSNILIEFVFGIFIVAISSVVYPMFSQLSVTKNYDELNAMVIRAIRVILILVLPITVVMIVLREEIVKLVFQRGAFDVQATSMTSYALGFYSLGMAAYGIREVLYRVFYSLKDTKTPMLNGILVVGMNIGFNFLLVGPLGVGGLGLATSVSAIVGDILLFIKLKAKIRPFVLEGTGIELMKIFGPIAGMTCVTGLIHRWVHLTDILAHLCICVFVGLASYISFMYVLKVKELKWMLDELRNFVQKKINNQGLELGN